MEWHEEKDTCEMCGNEINIMFSLCNDCDSKVDFYNERTGMYHMKNGEIVDTCTWV